MSEGLNHTGRPITIHVPEDLVKIRPDLIRFFNAMVYKLHRNKHKGRWADIDLQSSLRKLSGEVRELEEAINNGNTMEIIMEAADLGNWALIIANVALEKADVGETIGRAGTEEIKGTIAAQGQSNGPAGPGGEALVDGRREERRPTERVLDGSRGYNRDRNV